MYLAFRTPEYEKHNESLYGQCPLKQYQHMVVKTKMRRFLRLVRINEL